MSRHHVIPTRHEHMSWGYLEAGLPPVVHIQSGDTVELGSFPAGGRECLPPDLGRVPTACLEAIAALAQGAGPHFVTGPVYVEGALHGAVLRIDIPEAWPTKGRGPKDVQPTPAA